MRHRIALLSALLLLAALSATAQKRIKQIDITVAMPEVGADMFDGTKITAVKTDAFGSQDMLGEDKINGGGVVIYQFDSQGNRAHPLVEEKFQAGREYVFEAHVTNYTDILFNYKNDKEFTVDNTTVKATINGKPAKILRGSSGRPLLCEVVVKLPGERDPIHSNTKVSAADGEHAGHGYVDLGLPSGTLWATCNVGATKPEGYGNFYAYGETKPKNTYTRENFTGFGSYTYHNIHNFTSFAQEEEYYSTPTGMGVRLLPEFDAARQNMGGEWRLPTRLQAAELRENCYPSFVIVNGVRGTLWTSLKNGKSIFTPYSGSSQDGKVSGRGLSGYYQTSNGRRVTHIYTFNWGTMYSKDDIAGISMLEISTYEYNEDPVGDNVVPGLPVRAVWGGKEFSGDKTKAGATKTAKASKSSKSSDNGKDGNSSDGDGDKKKSTKSKMKGLLNKGRSLLNILR